jgi:hypothetical protein
MPKNSPWLAEKSATADRKIRYSWKKFRHH